MRSQYYNEDLVYAQKLYPYLREEMNTKFIEPMKSYGTDNIHSFAIYYGKGNSTVTDKIIANYYEVKSINCYQSIVPAVVVTNLQC